MRGHKSKRREDYEDSRGERGSRRDHSQGRRGKGNKSRLLEESDFHFEDQEEEFWLEMEKSNAQDQKKESHLKKMEKSKALCKAQPDEDNHEIKQEQEAKEAVERPQASHPAQLEDHREETRKIAAALKKAEDLLETERLSWQHEKISLLEMDKSRALFEDRLDEQNHLSKTFVAAPRNVEQKFESHQVEWQEENASFSQATEDFKNTVKDLQQEAKKAVERSQASHQAQLEEHKEETSKIVSALKKAEDHPEAENLCWQQGKISLLQMENFKGFFKYELEEQKQENKTLAAALRSVEEKLESRQVEWQKENTSLIQATERLKKTLQEWKEKESSMKAQLEDLMCKKKKKKKWYQRIFCWL